MELEDNLRECINNYRNIGRKIFSDQYLCIKNLDKAEELSYKEAEKWAYEHTDRVNITSVDFYNYVVSILKLGIKEELETYL